MLHSTTACDKYAIMSKVPIILPVIGFKFHLQTVNSGPKGQLFILLHIVQNFFSIWHSNPGSLNLRLSTRININKSIS